MSDLTIYNAVLEAHRTQVRHAVVATFGGVEPQSITVLGGGLSGTQVLKLVVDGRAYVVRVIDEHTSLNDPYRQFACMRIAADAGVAPPVRYADPEHGISIIDFIEAQPLRAAAMANEIVAAHTGEILRVLHHGPDFPPFLQTFQYIEGGKGHLAAMGAHLPPMVQTYFARITELRPQIESHLTMHPCHNDLNLNNLLFDGERVWLLDWEASCMGDPYHDLASITNWLFRAPEQQEALLQAYFERTPTAYERAKLLVMQQVTWCFYSTVFLLLAVGGGLRQTPAGVEDEALPSFEETRQAMWDGTMQLGTPEAMWRYGMILANESAQAVAQPAFERALRVLTSRR